MGVDFTLSNVRSQLTLKNNRKAHVPKYSQKHKSDPHFFGSFDI